MVFRSFLLGFLLLMFNACQTNPEVASVEDTSQENSLPAEKNSSQSTRAIALAEQQLKAYNDRDIDAFLLAYSDSVKVYGDLKTFAYSGTDKMRENYKGWFGGLDTLHCTVVKRIATGNTVIDHEEVMFQRPGQAPQNMEAIAIYKVENDKIQEVFFVRPKWE